MRFPTVGLSSIALFLFSFSFSLSFLFYFCSSHEPRLSTHWRRRSRPTASFYERFLLGSSFSPSMDSSTGSVGQSTSTTASSNTTTAVPSVASASPVRIGAITSAGLVPSSTYAPIGGGNSSGASTATAIAMPNHPTSNVCLQQQQQQQQAQQQQTQSQMLDIAKQEEFINLSLASGVSEGQRSLSGAPSASSSPILSPPGKVFGRNANGTMIATSRPSNEAEIQLYRVLQRASLLSYYDTLLEMGGDDVQQLYEAGEEEFLEIMALVGMASKPLHVRRLQKALHEWANNPSFFQGPVLSTQPGLCETPTKSAILLNPEAWPAVLARVKKLPAFNPTGAFNPTPLSSTAAQSQSSASASAASQLLSHAVCSPSVSAASVQPQSPMVAMAATLPLSTAGVALTATSLVPHVVQPSGSTAHQVSSSSPQLTPVLTELQVARITLGAEKIANQLPQREPRAQTSKKRTSRELEQVMAMSENDPRRMEEIRKYSAIYGRFDCKRRPEKPLTLHEVCVNEAAAQLCRLVPALLTRRDELFPLARQIVKDAGFGHSASIARYGGLLPQFSGHATTTTTTTSASSSTSSALTAAALQSSAQRANNVLVDCESSDSSLSMKRQRRLSAETMPAALDIINPRELNEDSRYNLFAMYQKFAKPPFDLTDIAKFSMGKTDYDENDNDDQDNEQDNDSRFSFSNSSNNSPSMMPHNGNGDGDRDRDRELMQNSKYHSSMSRCLEHVEVPSSADGVSNASNSRCDRPSNPFMAESAFPSSSSSSGGPGRALIKSCETRLLVAAADNSAPTAPFAGVQVISAAAAGHIIAVANPALVLSPALNDQPAKSLKREADTPDD